MVEQGRRFEVVGGANTVPKASKRALEAHCCRQCSDETKAKVTGLVQALISPMIHKGKVVSGCLMWCCVRCHRPYYLIRSGPKG